MRKFQNWKFILSSMGASILLSIIPLFSVASLGTRKSEDFFQLFLFLSTFPILLGVPLSLLHLLAFKKNIATDTARKLIFFPSVWVQIFLIPIIISVTCSILEELLSTGYFHVKWTVIAIIFDIPAIFYLIFIPNIRKKIKESFFDEDE
ncbi:hypothetical protein [Fibrobacter sp. UWR2]|uniref:hypothetical protein n=1 Tax=Fibrobacter sp. UWR2 TaxID=1964352 RepID=UPI000B5266AA|nr:hypothetical protein [Fibrobacter sp. UWR2]MBO7070260.1 hypothetical protein [Bacteroidales bacterium]OWU99146.1 hypothetical protein B7994_11975 [Fibrobacter sp. UWR2]